MTETSIYNISWALVLLILGFLFFIVSIVFFEYRYGQKKENKTKNPVMIAVLLGILGIIIILVLEFMNIIPAGWSKQNWWVFFLILGVAVYVGYLEMRKSKPMPMPNLERICWEVIYRRCRATPHKGDGFGSPLPFSATITVKGENQTYAKGVAFIARTTLDGGSFIYVVLDMNNGYMLKYTEKPDPLFVEKQMGKEVTQQFDLERAMLERSINQNSDNYERRLNENQESQVIV